MIRKAKVTYEPATDCYEIYTDTGDGWGFESSYKLLPNYKHPEGETCMVSFQMITKLCQLDNLGYSITFKFL